MALVIVLAIISLLAILAVATLSITTKLGQGSTLAARDAQLDAAASYALTTAVIEWRRHNFSSLAAGEIGQIDASISDSPVRASVTVVRLGSELFWIVATAVAVDDSRRREGLVVRLTIPRTDSMPALVAGGDVSLSRLVSVARDAGSGCSPSAPDLAIASGASFTSVDGSLPSLTVERNAPVADSSSLLHIGSLSIAALAASADLILPSGASTESPSGVVHAMGDLTLTGGAGQGVLVVDGRLILSGPVSYVGLIVARGGLVTTAPGAQLTGSIRAGSKGVGASKAIEIVHQFTLHPSVCATQMVLRSAVIPYAVSGRAWTEIY